MSLPVRSLPKWDLWQTYTICFSTIMPFPVRSHPNWDLCQILIICASTIMPLPVQSHPKWDLYKILVRWIVVKSIQSKSFLWYQTKREPHVCCCFFLSELLYLHENSLTGKIAGNSPFCERNFPLRSFYTDCHGNNPEVTCDCCTDCCEDGVDCYEV